ncbi:alpha/beta fold hydrolase [Streptomyces sp. NWU339]|uniref:alpha/beta fold hydrolase n=1 Tax=Streptomyces sp. NWU339 TaxID=2185284 RepID=UPI0015E80AB4|nr:hypothetical protein [Streptomyces sp. NWU339]
MVQNLSPRALADEDTAAEWLDLFEIAVLSGISAAAHRPRPPAPDRLAAYARITTPLRVVGFADDVLTPAHLSREVAAVIPGARYATGGLPAGARRGRVLPAVRGPSHLGGGGDAPLGLRSVLDSPDDEPASRSGLQHQVGV